MTTTPKTGDRVQINGNWMTLAESCGFSDSGFPGCQFRTSEDWRGDLFNGLAINVTVTGRTIRRIPGSGPTYGVKVRVEYVGDCEPSTFLSGWLVSV